MWKTVSFFSVSLLAATPDGHLHYWGNALRERSTPSVDGTVDVGTDQVTVATPILRGSGVVLFTSEGHLFFIPLPSESRVTTTHYYHTCTTTIV